MSRSRKSTAAEPMDEDMDAYDNANPSGQGDEEFADFTGKGNSDDEDEDEDEDMEDDGETFVVEAILNHRADFEDGLVRYLVKWKGYEEESDETWELEDQFVGARGILENYWEIIGGKPNPEPPAKKRGRHSGGTNGAPARKFSKKGGKSSSQDLDNGFDEVCIGTPSVPAASVGGKSDEWKPPIPAKGNWDDLVEEVETVELDEGRVLWAYLLWHEKTKDGRYTRNKVKATICYKACPQQMLRFYEKHLVLPKKDAVPLPAPAHPLENGTS